MATAKPQLNRGSRNLMKRPSDWPKVNLRGDPILVVGRRNRPRHLSADVVDLHEETFETMRAIARATTSALAGRTRLSWHPNAIAEPDEQYLSISVDELPQAPQSHRAPDQAQTPDADGRAR